MEPGIPFASARMPSSATIELIGFRSLAYRASTQWAIAFIPLGPVADVGRETVRAGS